MASSKLLLAHLRRSRPISYLPRTSVIQLFTNPNPLHSQPPIPSNNSLTPSFFNSLSAFHFLNGGRSFSTRPDDDSDYLFDSGIVSNPPEFRVDEALQVAINGSSSSGEELSLPIRGLISLLDGFHNLTGLPWWVVIATGTIAMRATLFPLLVLQMKKVKRISELFPQLPPPFPTPQSGRSFKDQFSVFQRKRKELGCPSYLWFPAYLLVQTPCFILWMTSIRRMSLDHHPGFDCGGILWFQNLTETPHGVLGSILPLLIASLHYTNVQLSLDKFSVQKTNATLESFSKYFKIFLHMLTVAILFISHCVPQGCLVYWLTNGSLNVIQQLSLKHPSIRDKLKLPMKESSTSAADSEQIGLPEKVNLDPESKKGKISLENLSPKKLQALSKKLAANGEREKAIRVLQLAIEKDTNLNAEALVAAGQMLMQQGKYAEATEYLERAISNLFLGGKPTQVKYVDLLIFASQWAGVACIRQGKNAQGIVHLERVASLEEPEDPKIKVHYFDSLVFLASTLYNEGRKAEAEQYLRSAVAFNPAFKDLLEQLENEKDESGNKLKKQQKKRMKGESGNKLEKQQKKR